MKAAAISIKCEKIYIFHKFRLFFLYMFIYFSACIPLCFTSLHFSFNSYLFVTFCNLVRFHYYHFLYSKLRTRFYSSLCSKWRVSAKKCLMSLSAFFYKRPIQRWYECTRIHTYTYTLLPITWKLNAINLFNSRIFFLPRMLLLNCRPNMVFRFFLRPYLLFNVIVNERRSFPLSAVSNELPWPIKY